jgi:hypothetical protein
MPVNPAYVDSSITLDVRKITLETNDRRFLILRFYPASYENKIEKSPVHTVYFTSPDDTDFEYMKGNIENGDTYVLMEAKKNAKDDTTE